MHMTLGSDSKEHEIKKGKVSLEDQVALDLANYLECFPNKTFAIRILAKESGLNQKTIRRLLARENRPTYQTLFKLYSIFLDVDNYSELMRICPPVVAKKIADYNPDDGTNQESKSLELLTFFKNEPLFAELFVLAGTGPLIRNAIAFRYGEYGLEVLDKLKEEGLIQEVEKDTYSLSRHTPPMDGECLKFLGEYFIHRFSKPGNAQIHNENTINFYAESLNEEGKV
ncbi:MAG: hypothetical protein NXH75_07235, partial [Halobacteriovoraceae bacterium]|nr:hypothetical protein [Halobacteriovoraceae bacterium]